MNLRVIYSIRLINFILDTYDIISMKLYQIFSYS